MIAVMTSCLICIRTVNSFSLSSIVAWSLKLVPFGVAINAKLLSSSSIWPSSIFPSVLATNVRLPLPSFFHLVGNSSGWSFQHFFDSCPVILQWVQYYSFLEGVDDLPAICFLLVWSWRVCLPFVSFELPPGREAVCLFFCSIASVIPLACEIVVTGYRCISFSICLCSLATNLVSISSLPRLIPSTIANLRNSVVYSYTDCSCLCRRLCHWPQRSWAYPIG